MYMKKDTVKIADFQLHIGTEHVQSRKEPIMHEASVLKQLKTIIEKNQRLIQQNEGNDERPRTHRDDAPSNAYSE